MKLNLLDVWTDSHALFIKINTIPDMIETYLSSMKPNSSILCHLTTETFFHLLSLSV